MLLLPVVAVVIVVGALYEKPAHSYQVNGNAATWAADVKIALSKSRSASPITPTGPLLLLPGVGKIDSVVVNKSPSGQKVAVMFMTGTGGNSGGLVYLHGYPPPSDTCNAHLSGPWWQLSPLNDTTMGCERGFHFTGGG